MTTNYKNRPVRSPIPPSAYRPQQGHRSQYDVSDKEHPIREEIKRLSQSFDLTVSFEEDTETMDLLNHISGFLGVLCTIKKDGQIIAQGRGCSVLNRQNRAERTLNSVIYGSFLSAANHAGRMLEALRITTADREREEQKAALGTAYRSNDGYGDELATDRQKTYLKELIYLHIDNESVQEKRIAQLDGMSKFEASEMIASFTR